MCALHRATPLWAGHPAAAKDKVECVPGGVALLPTGRSPELLQLPELFDLVETPHARLLGGIAGRECLPSTDRKNAKRLGGHRSECIQATSRKCWGVIWTGKHCQPYLLP